MEGRSWGMRPMCGGRGHELGVWGEGRYALPVYEEIKNCPRYWKVASNGRGTSVSSASLFGAQ
jgi:hypothetical protein